MLAVTSNQQYTCTRRSHTHRLLYVNKTERAYERAGFCAMTVFKWMLERKAFRFSFAPNDNAQDTLEMDNMQHPVREKGE